MSRDIDFISRNLIAEISLIIIGVTNENTLTRLELMGIIRFQERITSTTRLLEQNPATTIPLEISGMYNFIADYDYVKEGRERFRQVGLSIRDFLLAAECDRKAFQCKKFTKP